MMNKDKRAFFEKMHHNVAYNLHLSGVILIGIVNLPEDIYNCESGIGMFDYFTEPGAVHLIKNVEGQFHIFRVNGIKLAS